MREFVRLGVAGLVNTFVVIAAGVVAFIAMLVELARVRRERRTRWPEHLADRMDRAYESERKAR